jgi:hypothetical protein
MCTENSLHHRQQQLALTESTSGLSPIGPTPSYQELAQHQGSLERSKCAANRPVLRSLSVKEKVLQILKETRELIEHVDPFLDTA